MRYPSEMAITYFDPRGTDAFYRGALTYNGFTFGAAGSRHQTVMPSVGLAGHDASLRYGAMATWIPRDQGGRATDYRVGVLALPSPWLVVGAVADHANQDRLAAGRLQRRYTAGVGVRPLAAPPVKKG